MVAVSYFRSFSLLLVFLGLATALPTGAPPQACVSLMPGHGAAPIDPALRPPPYFIVSDLLMENGSLVYEPDETYNISLISVLGATFRGFIVQARDVNGSVIGMMDTSDSNDQARLVDCPDSNNATVTHVNNYDKSSVSFQWTAPSGFGGIVELRYSVVIMFSSYYVNLNAADFPLDCNITLTDVGTHPLIFRIPENCPRQECEYFVGLGLNPSDPTYLDVYLEGNAAGWIAIGFSNNTQMDNDDVLGCRVNSGAVTVVDTWNPSPRRAPNVLDATQDGLCVQSTSFTNGRITCSFSRLINGTDIGQDYDLDSLFYLLYGRRAADQGSTTSLGYHTINGGMTPRISELQYNPVNDNNTDGRCPIEVTGIASHNLVFGMPEGCLRADCEYYVGMSPNPSDPTYLDVYLEGNAAGWIAIGFSLNTQMDNDDVLGCRIDSGAVTVVDTWNPSPRPNPNELDATQDGLCVQSTSFTNGRITCRFSRTIAVTDVGQDYNLNSSYYLLFGRRAADQGNTTSLAYHTANGGMTPAISEQQYNPVVDNNANERCPDQATAIGSHSLVFGMPPGCDRGSCEYYVGMSPNPSNPTYLDVYLEGNAAGWIAIGFSLNTQMENDDVLGCRVNSGTVTVVDTWNPSPRRAANVLDATQDGLCVQSTSFTNGRITCRFSRTIAVTDVGQDYNLNSSYYLLFGRRAAGQGTTQELSYHTADGGMTPTVSQQQYNPVVDNNNNTIICPAQTTAVGSHNLVFGMPQGCERSSCEYYVGLSPNPSDPRYLDVYLEGNAAGWIAIGFSNNTQMENDDVLGCRVNSGNVTVVDTWNPSPRRTANMLDATQDGLCVESTSFTNGRITCRFSRTIAVTDVGQDYNLDSSYYLLFGRRAADQGATPVLGYHTVNGGMTPNISAQQYNPVRDRNTGGCPPAPPADDLVYTFQQGTQGSEYYFGARINRNNPLYLDMRLEAPVSGWVGVGFSLDNRMGVDDVLACQRDPNSNMVTAVDTWNPGPAREPNQIDPGQVDMCPYTGDFANGRITCTFSRLINTGDTDNDFNLGMALFQLYGTSNAGGVSSLAQHGETPDVTAEAIVVTNATGAPTDDFPRRELTRVHGILMIVAWPLLVVSAIFFALWMKPALPNGEWFQVHRAFMIVSLFLTALGFIFIFVANAKNPGAPSPGLISFACGKSTSHFVIGIIVFILQIMNPIIAIFRCKPTGSYRWIFNVIHGTAIGFLAEILALVNVGLGIALFESGCGGTNSFTLLWVYIVFVILLVIIQLVLSIVFTVLAFRAPPEKRAALGPTFLKYYFQRSAKSSFSPPQKGMEMTEKGKAASNDPPPKKKPSEDSPFRWGGFGVFIIVTFVLVVVMAIMVAVI